MGLEGVDLSARDGVSPSMDGHSDFINLSVSKPRREPRLPLTLRPTPNIRELPHCTLLTLCLQPSLPELLPPSVRPGFGKAQS